MVPGPGWVQAMGSLADLPDLLPRADVVILLVPVTPATTASEPPLNVVGAHGY